jgi:lysophospholipid acyltransferase (LPLAT)-like uncharacterized protein
MLRRFASEAGLTVASSVVAAFFWFVRRTNFLSFDPPDTFYQPIDSHRAVIFTFWHGEVFLTPFLPRRGDRLMVLVGVHRDGEIIARAGSLFGLTFIRGSGDHGGGRDFVRKRAVQAFSQMLRFLRGGGSVILTADVPKAARVAGLGIVTLAKHSQCPIVPVAMVTSRRYRLANWDRTCINLPFGRMVFARGEPILVPAAADAATLEAARQAVQASLDAVVQRAYAHVDG